MFLNELQIEHKFFFDNCVKTKKQIFYDVGLFDGFENTNEVVQENITFNARQIQEIEVDGFY